MKCDIGHFEIKAGDKKYNLTPSFENIMKLGSPAELVEIYSKSYKIFNPDKKPTKHEYFCALGLAYDVIMACCDDDPSNILIDVIYGEKGHKMILKSTEQVTAQAQLIIASGLLKHGIAGVRKNPSKSEGGEAKEVDLWEFVHSAMAHFSMSKQEALSLTMTEFVRLLDAKFPPEQNGGDTISDDEYKQAMQLMNKNRQARGEEEWQPNK